MRAPVTLRLLAALLLAGTLGPLAAREEKEPAYDGKPLSEWIKQLGSAKVEDRRKASAVLEQNIDPKGQAAVPALVKALKDKDESVRANAANALIMVVPDAKAVPALVKALKDGDPGVRALAAQVLTVVGPDAKAAVPALSETLRDKDPTTRLAVAATLGRIGPGAKAAASPLAKALKDEHPLVRRQAVYALGKIGPAAKAAAGALEGARKDKDFRVRQAAAWALVQIDPKAAKRAGVEEPLLIYNASLGNSARGFDRADLGFGFKPSDTSDLCVLWVNGDPVAFFGTDQGSELHLNPWLRPGKNELTLSGKHRVPLYVKVHPFHAGGLPTGKLAGKRVFPAPGGAGKAEPLVFTVGRAAKLPEREELSDRPKDRARHEKEARALVAELQGLVRARKGKEAARLLCGPSLVWAKAIYGSAEEHQQIHDQVAKALSDPKLKPAAKDPPLRLLFGKRSVLVYGEPPKGSEDRPYTFTVEKGPRRAPIGPLELARVGGKWVVWDVEPTSLSSLLALAAR